MYLVKNKASQKRTSRRSTAVKVGEDKGYLSHRKKIRFITGRSCSVFSCGLLFFASPASSHSSEYASSISYLQFKDFKYLDFLGDFSSIPK